ncbi:MAG: thiamine biosynthesis protein [Candidatus Eisenbacteria bacterium]|nr:thiamine biosynthesis protein [Candidatus Eisenbacteria bacterium]
MTEREPIKALAMLSGGLDSSLALHLIKAQGIEVEAVNFHTGFCLTDAHRALGQTANKNGTPYRNEALRAGAHERIPVRVVDVSKDYLPVVTQPRYGYGSAMNPCIDCRIFMLRRARTLMDEIGAKFVFTGEVLGQRPMTQHLRALQLIEREAGLEGLVLRPLSARLLPPTIPEKEGWVDREQLMNISGRSRRAQIELADQFQIGEYPQPAGGCCSLVDANFGRRLRDLYAHRDPESIQPEEYVMLKLGRHLRLAPGLKLIVGRNEGENKFLEMWRGERWLLGTPDHPGPLTLLDGEPTAEQLLECARIAARYCDGKREPKVRVLASRRSGESRELDVAPRGEYELASRLL